MSATTNNNDSGTSNTCANCGKEGSNVTNTCNKCKMVMYCNAACKKKHRHKHKKDCEEHLRLAAERAAELHDEALFKQPPPQYEDCPICFLRMPTMLSGFRYQICCGKVICSGCSYAPVYDEYGNVVADTCPFCRSPPTTDKEVIRRMMKRVEAGDAIAIRNFGNYYQNGEFGFPQNYTNALELYHRAADRGNTAAYYDIGNAFCYGRGVEVDRKKAFHYWEIAAIGGCVDARHNLGITEENNGNTDRALKHYKIAVRSGCNRSLDTIRKMVTNATKDDYAKALAAYQVYLDEIKSTQRDEAAEAHKKQCERRAVSKSFQRDEAAAAEDECKYY